MSADVLVHLRRPGQRARVLGEQQQQALIACQQRRVAGLQVALRVVQPRREGAHVVAAAQPCVCAMKACRPATRCAANARSYAALMLLAYCAMLWRCLQLSTIPPKPAQT